MAIPSNGLVLDFNPALAPQADGVDVFSVTAGGREFLVSGGAAPVARYGTDALGQRALLVPGTMMVLHQSDANPGMQPQTWLTLFKVPGDDLPTTGYFGQNDATLTATTSSEDPTRTQWLLKSGNPIGSPVLVPVDTVATLAMSLEATPSDLAVGYKDGVEVVRGVGSIYTPANTPAFLGTGHIYRSLWWDRVLSPAEIAAVDAELRQAFIPRATIAWEAPLHTSGPVLGYQLSLLVDGVHTVVDLGPDVLTYQVAGSGVVEVRAVTKYGLSAPAQAVL